MDNSFQFAYILHNNLTILHLQISTLTNGDRNKTFKHFIRGKTPKQRSIKRNLRQALVLFKYLKPHRGKFILGLVFIALSAFTTSLFPLFLGKMIDAASPGATLPGMDSSSKFGFGFKNIHWSLNTTLLLIFAQLTVQTFFHS
jgi:hypothetical protein